MVNWGYLSTARINRQLHDGLSEVADARAVAVASRDLARAEAQAAEFGIDRAYGSYEELLADPSIDVIYNSLPNEMHFEWTVRALEAGKHVLCEKPFTRRPREADEAFDLADQRGLLLMEAFMWRHHPQTHRLVELVAEGAVGRLSMIRCSFSFVASTADVRLQRGLDGGALMDVGCYCISAGRLLAGEPERVAAEQVLGGDGVDVVFGAVLRFAGDVIEHFDAGLALSPRRELEVAGDGGSIYVAEPWHPTDLGLELRRSNGSVERITIPPASHYALQVKNFSDAVRGEATPLLGREDALGQARTIEALYAAADSGQTVTL